MILSWDKPEKVMSTEEWQRISADGAPPGVYVPNMSQEDMLKWKARYVGGANPRVEIRKTVIGPKRPSKRPGWDNQNCAQVLIIVDSLGVRISANGTMEFAPSEIGLLATAVAEARRVLIQKGAIE